SSRECWRTTLRFSRTVLVHPPRAPRGDVGLPHPRPRPPWSSLQKAPEYRTTVAGHPEKPERSEWPQGRVILRKSARSEWPHASHPEEVSAKRMVPRESS